MRAGCVRVGRRGAAVVGVDGLDGVEVGGPWGVVGGGERRGFWQLVRWWRLQVLLVLLLVVGVVLLVLLGGPRAVQTQDGGIMPRTRGTRQHAGRAGGPGTSELPTLGRYSLAVAAGPGTCRR